jgi:tetratricopeptide (TPR) repeat protein
MIDPQSVPTTPTNPPAPDANESVPLKSTQHTPMRPSAADAPAIPGPRYGRFALQRFHARGGLGEVHVAVDEELRREVALKRMQERCASDPGARRRFLNEAEITAKLEHPGVVPIHGLVQDENGQPCYAMRFIEGESLAEAIKQWHAAGSDYAALPFRQMLQRFVSVCQTIAFAHSKHIIHRDIKPANIMLGPFGETLVVDWGLARELTTDGSKPSGKDADPSDQSSTVNFAPSGDDDRVYTRAGQALGTLGYIAPEQAAGRRKLVGPSSDIYGLGATLYEMLTGERPIRGEDQSEALQNAQAGRFPPPRHRKPDMPKALDAVCLKAMAFEPAERYASAKDLAADLEHWLADEPVAAFAEPWLDRFGRWARKHKAIMATAAAVLVTATIGLAVGLFFVNAEKDRTELARRGEEAQRIEAQAQAELARQNAKTATENLDISRAVLDFVEKRVFAAARPKDQESGLGREVQLRQAIEAALPFVEKSFPNQPMVEAQLRMTMGLSFLDLGASEIATEQFQTARRIYTEYLGPDHPNTIRSMHNLANGYAALGRRTDALRLREDTLPLMKAKLGLDHLDTLKSMMGLASSYHEFGRHADAIKLNEETLALAKAKLGPDHASTLKIMNNLANNYSAVGRHADALELHQQTLALKKSILGPGHRDTLSSMHNLALSYRSNGRQVQAVELLEETLRLKKSNLGPDHPDTLLTMGSLAESYGMIGRHADGKKLFEETLPLMKSKLGPDHPTTLRTMGNLANSYGELGRHADAPTLFQETLALQKAKLGPDHPDTLMSMGKLAVSLFNLNRSSEAVPIIDECLKLAAGKSVHPQLIPGAMNLRLRHFVRAKDATGCGATAEMWEKLNRSDADSLYTAACMRAVTAAVVKQDARTPGADAARLTSEEADRAMAWLQKAVAAGYKNVERMKKDKDLDALRQREDFQKLVRNLEGKT